MPAQDTADDGSGDERADHAGGHDDAAANPLTRFDGETCPAVVASGHVALPPVELLVEADGGADQGQMSECLREVAEQLAGRADLLREQPGRGGVGQQSVEVATGPHRRGPLRLIASTYQNEQIVNDPFVAVEAVVAEPWVVAVDQRAVGELVADRVQRARSTSGRWGR